MSKNMNSINEKYFTWADAWVFTSIYYSIKDNEPLNLSKIIGTGDMLNHSILNKEELNSGFYKLQKYGVIKILDGKIIYTDFGKIIITNSEKTKGGLFSRIDITLKKLNSNRIKLPINNEFVCNEIFTDELVNEEYLKYFNMIKK